MAKSNQTEPITVDIFVDGSLLEVFINERFGLTTRKKKDLPVSRRCSRNQSLFQWRTYLLRECDCLRRHVGRLARSADDELELAAAL